MMDAQKLPGAIFALRNIFTSEDVVSGKDVRKCDTTSEK
jgi:hypothetical protein